MPGVPPTNKPLEVPFTSVVNIRGDRLYHEHIAWDQATLLRQLGLLPEVCDLLIIFCEGLLLTWIFAVFAFSVPS